ncbi:MAG: stage II sporulation protein M [Candidatus Hydrogenedentes bacterium]|nr:stage II sporulation protein M [Candidatus Hydrogenedentota bacterium]
MIIDLQRFLKEERPHWKELEELLALASVNMEYRMTLEQARRLQYLYERTATGLSKLTTFASEPELRHYLESLVARAYAEIHEERDREKRFSPLKWFLKTFPQTFRRHKWAFGVSCGITLVGILFGGFAVQHDAEAKDVLMPFPNLQIDPRERVEREEEVPEDDKMAGMKAQGMSWYFTHNTKVAIMTMAVGVFWGIGSAILLFYNGVILGAVCLDYIRAHETTFLIGWLLPHGSVEIPAILIAGQAGLVLGAALIGGRDRHSVRGRLRVIAPDLVTLMAGVAIMLAWAGFVESFLSQYHEPVIPYVVKISFGGVELICLAAYLLFAGREKRSRREDRSAP